MGQSRLTIIPTVSPEIILSSNEAKTIDKYPQLGRQVIILDKFKKDPVAETDFRLRKLIRR